MQHISSTLAVPDSSYVPRHVAIIMDGNGRWATQRHLPRVAGHSRGLDAVRAVVELVGAHNIIAKTLGRGNPFNTVRATLNGLSQLRDPHEVMHLRRAPAGDGVQSQVQVG